MRLALRMAGLLLLCGAVATSTFILTKRARSSGPVLGLESDYIDFGRRLKGEAILAEIPISNLGRKPLVLSQFKTSCGCINFKQITDRGVIDVGNKIVLDPGEETMLLTGIISGELPSGERIAKVAFQTNDPDHRAALITMKVTMDGSLASFPSVVDFGDLPVGSTESRNVLIRDTGRLAPINILDINSTSHSVNVEISTNDDNHGSTRSNIVARLYIEVEADRTGTIQEEVIVWEEGREEPSLRIPVVANVTERFVMQPTSLALPRQSSEGPVYSGSIVVRSVSNKEFTLAPSDDLNPIEVSIRPGFNKWEKFIDIHICDKYVQNMPAKQDIVFIASSAAADERLTLTIELRQYDY